MPRLEIHSLSDLRGEAAVLLAERFAAQRLAEPLLPDVDDFEAHLPEFGHVATRNGEAVAYLGGAVDDDHKLARWLFAGHAAREPEALRDLYALQAADFGVSRFMLAVPATDPGLIDVWFRLAFGCQAVWAVQEVTPHQSIEFGGTVRPGTPDDVEAVIDFDEILYTHQRASPSFSELATPSRAEIRAEYDEVWSEPETYTLFVAEVEDRIVAELVLFRRPEGDLRVPARNVDLAFAASRPEARGGGSMFALVAHAMNWAHEHGYRSMTTDWRSVNLLSSRYWPARGFRPQYLRLYRSIP